MNARFYVGDVFDVMAGLETSSVDLILTSPPFLALRSYLPQDHADKAKEIGSEPNPAAFIDTLLRLTAEWDRLLAPHGSICIELGDTYASAGGVTDNRAESLGGNDFAPRAARGGGRGWPLDKSLALIPELYRVALAYGINPLTGEPSPAGRWRVRNVVRWHRPNPPVGALGDKFRPATSDLVVACKSRSRYFDLDAVREPYSELTMRVKGEEWANGDRGFKTGPKAASGETGRPMAESRATHAGAPPLDTWTIPTHPYKGAHYATWPPDLCVRPIKAMSPERVCVTCGEPSRRIVGDVEYVRTRDGGPPNLSNGHHGPDESVNRRASGIGDNSATRVAPTVGWSDCGHDNYRPGLVLDPFAGSGTTLMVATGHGRDALGIDLDPRNLDLARQRIGMFLEETV